MVVVVITVVGRGVSVGVAWCVSDGSVERTLYLDAFSMSVCYVGT